MYHSSCSNGHQNDLWWPMVLQSSIPSLRSKNAASVFTLNSFRKSPRSFNLADFHQRFTKELAVIQTMDIGWPRHLPPKTFFFTTENNGIQPRNIGILWWFFDSTTSNTNFIIEIPAASPPRVNPPGLWQWTQELLRFLPPRASHWKHGKNVSYWKHLIAPLKPTLIRLFNYVYHRLTVHHYLQTRQFL